MLIITIINCKFGKCNHYGKLITCNYGKCSYGKSIMANITKPGLLVTFKQFCIKRWL